MRLLRPQQLIAIKGGYQIGRESRLGISVVAGCYLSRPEHFVSEAQIWESWQRAPLSFPVLDAAEPKPFAEYLIAGHAGIGRPVTALDVSARVGGLSRHWRIEGEGRSDAARVAPFVSMAMDHPAAWGGKTLRDNPLGRGSGDGLNPLLMSMDADGTVHPHAPLAAPTPVPHEFHARQAHLDKVKHSMASQEYLESIFPGLPSDIDRRFFQLAASEQWLPEEQWPDHVPFQLQGFRAGQQAISGVLPQVRGRAFVCRHGTAALEEVALQRKTLWFLPDSDVALMIYTGNLPIAHLFDEPIQSLLVALDRCDAPRSAEHFQRVYDRRSDEQASAFECLLDRELMPEAMGLNVITSISDHPDSSRYDATPMSSEASADYYQRIRDAIALHDRPQAQATAETVPPAMVPESQEALLYAEHCRLEDKSFGALRFSGQLTGKTFLRCDFAHADFSQAVLSDCLFEQCLFHAVSLNGTTLNQVRLVDCTLQQTTLTDSHLHDCTLEKVRLEAPSACGLKVERSTWDYCVFNDGSLHGCSFHHSSLASSVFSDTHMTGISVQHGQIDACIFNRCDAREITCSEVLLSKSSLMAGDWRGARFERCQLQSLTAGMQVNFAHSMFSDCRLDKVGLKQASLLECQLLHCSFTETNLDQADLTRSFVSACDMAGVRLMGSVLVHSYWHDTSLQQGMLYNADLRGAKFDHCNLAAANLAMTWQDAGTDFNDGLLDRVCWVPRRLMHGEHPYAH